MLRQEFETDTEHTPTRPTSTEAAHVYVSPNEFARALASLDARQESRDGEPAIEIGEAIHQLGLSVPADAVLREVEALRAAEAMAQRSKTRHRSQRRVLAGAGLGALLLFILFTIRLSRTSISPSVATPSPTTVFADSSPYIPLSLATEGQLVHCDFATLRNLAQGASQRNVIVDTRYTDTTSTLWTIQKRGGEFYVQCWANEEAALKVMNGHAAVVYASQNVDGISVGRVSLDVPLSRFKSVGAPITVTYVGDPGRTGDSVIATELRP